MALQRGLQKFYSSCNKFTDFTLVSSNGDEVKCHKIILASRSEFFLDMFTHIDEESSDERLVIEDASSKDLQAMVDFMYTDQVSKENGTIGLWTLADKFLMEDLKLKCLEFIIDTIDLNNANAILNVFDVSHSRHLLTGEMSWSFSTHIKFDNENCIEKFLIGHFHDLPVLKINALYFIKDNWNEIESSDQFRQMKEVYPEDIGIIEQFVGPNILENPVTIPFKITLSLEKKLGFGFQFYPGWKYPAISKLLVNSSSSDHGGMKEGNLILRIGNISFQYLEQSEYEELLSQDLPRMLNETEYVSFEIGALDKRTIQNQYWGS